MAKCAVCSKGVGLFSSKTKIQDGVSCIECLGKSGIIQFENATNFTAAYLKEYATRRIPLVANFKPTKSISHTKTLNFKSSTDLMIDENSKTFVVGMYGLFEISNLLSFELLEDGQSIVKGGLGGAIVGGALFGGVGAVVGSLTGASNKKVCNSMRIRITVKNSHVDTAYIDIVTSQIKTNNIVYKTAQEDAQKYLSALQIIADMNNTANTQPTAAIDTAAELQKFHALKEQGIITEDEFNAKKAQLLGM